MYFDSFCLTAIMFYVILVLYPRGTETEVNKVRRKKGLPEWFEALEEIIIRIISLVGWLKILIDVIHSIKE